MRTDIKMLCVTNWNAILELRTQPYKEWEYGAVIARKYHNILTVADPDAIDAGQVIALNEIKLVIRLKAWKCMPVEILKQWRKI